MAAAAQHLPDPDPGLSIDPAPHLGVDPVELWTIGDLIAFLPWGRSSVYALVRAPGFPAALQLAGPRGRRRVWVASEVRAWALAAPRSRSGSTRPAPCGHRGTGDTRRTRVPEPGTGGAWR